MSASSKCGCRVRDTQADLSTLSLADVSTTLTKLKAPFPHYISLGNRTCCVLIEKDNCSLVSMTRIDPIIKFVFSPLLFDDSYSYFIYLLFNNWAYSAYRHMALELCVMRVSCGAFQSKFDPAFILLCKYMVTIFFMLVISYANMSFYSSFCIKKKKWSTY